MSEQSLLERIHGTHHPVTHRNTRPMLLVGAAIGVIGAIYLGSTVGLVWGLAGILLTAACLWGLFAPRARHA
jgi:hypothetical protein